MGNICSCLPFFSSENENIVDVSPLLEMVSDVSQLDALISSIEQRLVAIANAMDKESASSSSAQETASSSAAQETAISLSAAQVSASTSAAHETASSSAAQEAASSNDFHRFGNDLLEKVLTRVHGRGCKMCFMSKLNRETRKVVIDVLKGVGQSHWMAAGLSVLGYVLDQIDQVSANRGECVQLLRYMCALAKRLRQLNEQLPSEKEKLNEAVQFIVKGSIMCLGQMRSHPLFRFISASVGAADLQSIESQIRHIYPDLIFGAVVGVLERLPVVLPPSQGENLPATGVEAARDRVIGLLNMEMNDMSRIAVVVYGVGGIGKTTLATAAFKMLDLTGYKFCRVDIEQDCSVEYLKLLQKQILRDLFGRNIYLRSSEEGNQQLTESFREVKQPLFMFVDNALRGSDLARLLPTDLSALPKRMRILITTRKLNETDMLIHRDILRREYSVDCLSEAESKKMLCEKALCAPGSNFPQSVDIDSLVKVCGGIPLVLEMVASKLKRHVNNVPLCNEMVKSLKEAPTEGEGDMSEKVVDVVYNSLDEDCREAFLDISCFFHNRGRRIVGYAVGIVELQALEDAALVKVSPHENYSEDRFDSLVYFVSHLDEQQGIVRVHDIVRARGRRLSQGDRITDMESLEEALGDTQMLQKIKGIRLSSEFTLEAEQLDRMNSSLRVLDNEALQINGRCRRRFPNLRYVDLGCGYLPMDLNKLKRLSVLSRPSIKDNVCELPSSLHLLRPSTVSNPDALLKNLGYLLWLEDLYIADPTIVSLPEHCLGQLKSLRFLDMSYSTSLSELPEDFGYLHALEGLSLNHCSQLASLTPNFGGLRSLKLLDMVTVKP